MYNARQKETQFCFTLPYILCQTESYNVAHPFVFSCKHIYLQDVKYTCMLFLAAVFGETESNYFWFRFVEKIFLHDFTTLWYQLFQGLKVVYQPSLFSRVINYYHWTLWEFFGNTKNVQIFAQRIFLIFRYAR